MDRSAERPLDEAVQDIDELHRLVLTGFRAGTAQARTFRERLKHIAAQGDGHRAVKAACDEADGLAVPAFAAPGDATRIADLEVAVLALAIEVANANVKVGRSDMARPQN
jgi:hypothetical protein